MQVIASTPLLALISTLMERLQRLSTYSVAVISNVNTNQCTIRFRLGSKWGKWDIQIADHSLSIFIIFLITSIDIPIISYFHLLDRWGHCRWSPTTGESLLFIKYHVNKLDILDIEKTASIWKAPIQLEEKASGNKKTIIISL